MIMLAKKKIHIMLIIFQLQHDIKHSKDLLLPDISV